MELPSIAKEVINIGRSNFTGSSLIEAAKSKIGSYIPNGILNGSTTEPSSGETPSPDNVGGNPASSTVNYDNTYSQAPESVSSDTGSSSGVDSKVLCYPANLGSDNVSHFVKFEVFIVKTENLNLLGGGDTKAEYEEFDKAGAPVLPRNAQHNSGVVSDIQKNQVKYTKLQEMIGLPIPDGLLADYSMAWSKSEGGFISGVVSLTDSVLDSEKRDKLSALNYAALGTASGIAGLAAKVGMDGAETNLKLLTKRASNPRNEFLFDGVNNRSFNMSWKFIPKDAKESETIRLILEKMKLYMHPELDESTSGKFYIFPAIFDISFMAGSVENEYLHRASSCALTNMTVNHNAAGMASFFDGTNAPFAYEVMMQFTELEFLHRARFLTKNNPNGVAR